MQGGPREGGKWVVMRKEMDLMEQRNSFFFDSQNPSQ